MASPMRQAHRTGQAATIMLAVLAAGAPGAGRKALPIVPGAHGFGMGTPAGSGRHLPVVRTRIFKVTHLKDAGPGSLREALEAEGPRTVVFEVSGNIEMVGTVTVRHPYLTVAGQTAPSPGVTLKRCELSIRADDVLLQHLRVRVGDLLDPNRPERNAASGWSQWSERDNMKVSGRRVVVDHCSFSWATDENVQSRGSELTFRHCIFSEGLNSPRHHKGLHSKGLIVLNQGVGEGLNVAVIGSLFAHNADRNPTAGAGARVVIANNLIYNATDPPRIGITLSNAPRRETGHGGGTWASVVGNHFDNVPRAIRFISRPNEEVGKVFLGEMLYSATHASGKVVTEHIRDPWTAANMLIFKEWCGQKVHPERSKVAKPPIAVEGLRILPVREVRQWVLARAGARPSDRDAVDRRVVRSVRERTGKILRSQADVGGWPKLAHNRRALTIPPNPCGDDDGDGYTNLEGFLHRCAADVEGSAKQAPAVKGP